MKITERDTSYGKIKFVEVAGIDMSKDKTHSIEFKPEIGSYVWFPGSDKRLEKFDKKKVTDEEIEDFKFFYNTVYLFPLEEVNLDWHIINKDFKPEDEYLSRMKKQKSCPITMDNSSFMNWFVKVQPYLNDEWKENNKSYIEMMELRILKNNEEMLEAFKNQNIKEIRKTIKLAGNINFEKNNKSPLIYTIENENIDLMKYLINKKVHIPNNLNINEDNKVYEILTNYQKTLNKKNKPKI